MTPWRSQFNIIHPASGLKVDLIALQETRFDADRLERAVRHVADEGFDAFFSTPEDLIVKKLDFFREGGHEKHLRDIASMMQVSGEAIDRAYVTRWAERLGLTELWQAILKRIEAP